MHSIRADFVPSESFHSSESKIPHSKKSPQLTQHVVIEEQFKALAHPDTQKDNNLQQKPGLFSRAKGAVAAGLALSKGAAGSGLAIIVNEWLWFLGPKPHRFTLLKWGLEEDAKKYQEQLKLISGDSALNDVLSLCIDKIEKSIPVFLDQLGHDYQLADEAVDTLKHMNWPSLLQALLPKIVINLAQKMREKEKNADLPINLATLTSFLCTELIDGLDKLDRELDEIRSNNSDQLAKPQLEKMLQEHKKNSMGLLSKHLLALLFPNGASDLPLARVVSWGVWKVISSQGENLLLLVRDLYEASKLTGLDKHVRQESEEYLKWGLDYAKDYVLENRDQVAAMIVKDNKGSSARSSKSSVSDYLSLQIQEIIQGKHSGIHRMALLFNDLLTRSFAHILKGVREKEEDHKHIFSGSANQLLISLIHFYKKQEKALDSKYRELEERGVLACADKEFIALFEPLLNECLERFGISRLPLPLPIRDLIQQQLSAFGLPVLADLYCRYQEGNTHRSQVFKQSTKRIEQGLGPQAVEVMQTLGSFGISTAITTLKETMIELEDPLTKQMRRVRLDEEIPFLKHPVVEMFLCEVQDVVLLSSLQVMAYSFDSRRRAKLPLDHTWISEGIERILSVLLVYSKEEVAAIDAALNHTPVKKDELKRLFSARSSSLLSLLKPVQERPVALFSLLPPFAFESLWQYVETTALPDLLISFYEKRRLGQKLAEIAESEILTVTGSNARTEVCSMFASYLAQLIPITMKLDKDTLGEGIIDMLQHTCDEASVTSPIPYLEENKERLTLEIGKVMEATSRALQSMQPIIAQEIKHILIQSAAQFTKQIDALENPKGVPGNEFLFHTVIRLMSVVANYLEQLDAIARKHNVSAFYHLDHAVLIKELIAQDKLHKGVPQSQAALEAQKKAEEALKNLKNEKLKLGHLGRFATKTARQEIKQNIRNQKILLQQAQKIIDEERLIHFFNPLIEAIFPMVVHTDMLPLPEGLKLPLLDLAKKTLPGVFIQVLRTSLTSGMINQAIIETLKKYHVAPDTENPIDDKPQSSSPLLCVNKDVEEALTRASSNLFHQFSRLIPRSLCKGTLSFKVIRDVAGKKIAQTLQAQLSQFGSLQQIIDLSLPSLVESLGGGRLMYENAQGNLVPIENTQSLRGKTTKFVPLQKEEPKEELKEEEKERESDDGGPLVKVKFPMPDTQGAQEMEDVKKIREEAASFDKVKTNVQAFIRDTISKSAIKVWESVTGQLLTEDRKQRLSSAVSKFWNWISGAHPLIKILVSPVLLALGLVQWGVMIALSPFMLAGWIALQLFWFCWDYHISKQVDSALSSIHAPIHEDLCYKIADEFVKGKA